MSHCPSCGRYVGPYEACPYCGAHLGGRVSIRLVKIGAVLLATVGLAVLWFAATRSQVPLIQAGQAGATMNMAYARVEGRVVRGPTYYADSGYLSFTVDDGTGEIRVAAYRKEADALRAEGRVPALGDQVSVAGTLRVREEDVAMTLNVPEHLEIVRPEAVEREIGSLTPEDYLRRVMVRGQVWEVRQPYEGLTLVTLRDSSGAVDVAIPQSLEELTGAFLPVEPGQSVDVAGAVDLYHDTVQVVPASVMDVVLLSEPVVVAAEVNAGALSAGDAGRMVTLHGTVTGVDPFSAGVKFTLDDGTGEVTVLLWQDTYDELDDPAQLAAGARVRVMGEVSAYHGEVEIVPQRAIDVEVLAAGTGAAPVVETNTPISIGDISADLVGSQVLVEGAVVGVESFSSLFKFTLDDGTGQIALVLWLSAYDELTDPAGLNVGAQVRVSGEVDEYQGSLQVVPSSGADVTVLSAGVSGTALREIGSLSAEDAGAAVAVAGEVTRAEPFSDGFRVWVSDGSGEVMLLLWQNVYERVAGRERLVPGARVQAAGVVQEYQGSLEVVPVLPVDVVVEGE